MSDVVPFVDLHRQVAALRPDLDAAIAQQLDRGDFICGQALEEFEAAFAAYCGTSHCIGVASGTAALTLALRAAGIGRGDEVITAANTFAATAFAIIEAGAAPVLVDAEPETGLASATAVQAALTADTRAIIPVHLHGRMADMPSLCRLAASRDIVVIEDACQAHGAALDGRRAGSWGTAAAFSFYPSKNLGAFGDGGAVTTADPEFASTVHALRNLGAREKYRHDVVAPNERLDTLQAAVLQVKLAHLDAWNAARQQAADAYRAALQGLPLRCPIPASPGAHVYHLFVIELEDEATRDALQARLHAAGVATGIHYPIPLPELVALRPHLADPDAFPVTRHLAKCTLSLPMFPELSRAQIAQVTATIRSHFGSA